MTEDYHNGLTIVRLESDALSRSILSASSSSSCEHPWRNLFQPRKPPSRSSTKCPESQQAPSFYMNDSSLRGPSSSNLYRTPPARARGGCAFRSTSYDYPGSIEVHETIRLSDVEAFRATTAKQAMGIHSNDKNHNNHVDQLTADLSLLSTDSSPSDSAPSVSSSSDIRPVIYRYIDVIEKNIALLEAIHFELFMPDRPDLRFVGIPFHHCPSHLIEGDYCTIKEVRLLSSPSFAVRIDNIFYPVVWEGWDMDLMTFNGQRRENGLAYIIDRKSRTEGGEMGVVSFCDRGELFLRSPRFVDSSTRRLNSIVRVSLRTTSSSHLYAVEPPPRPPLLLFDDDCDRDIRNRKEQPLSEYAELVKDIRTSSQRSAHLVCAVDALDAVEAARIDDRLGAFAAYGRLGDLRIMNDLFQLGSAFRVSVGRTTDASDAAEMRVDEGVILRTMREGDLPSLQDCRPLLDAIYGRPDTVPVDTSNEKYAAPRRDGTQLLLNTEQSRVVRMYTEEERGSAPRVFCVLSPPGSGKTTVAAAMAAALARSNCSVQLLMSVQNVAVDNMGAALAQLEYGGAKIYNMKSNQKLDPHQPTPFDYFDSIDDYGRRLWQKKKDDLEAERRSGSRKYQNVAKKYDEKLTDERRDFEKTASPTIILSTVEMMLFKMFAARSNIAGIMSRVDRIIIDEASLLTEAALFCIIRRFPHARLILIGDDRQLPPFMYDERILGHELAGRPSLSVAMKNRAAPIIRLTEVYRAPPSLVEPYNRLAYGGTLRSRKPEGAYPLSDLGLIPSGCPQLLFIDVQGSQERDSRNMSLSNENEKMILIRLLKKFPRGSEDQIMIICLYKEQKRRVQDVLGKNYTVLTVDSSQGKEKPIVILLTTRTQHASDMGFFCCEKRCNVSISRQQSALIILGKSSLLTAIEPWSTVVNGDDFTRLNGDCIGVR